MTYSDPTELKPFEEKAVCPKCGWKTVGVYFCSGKAACNHFNMPWDRQEHLARPCARCHYEWTEAPLA